MKFYNFYEIKIHKDDFNSLKDDVDYLLKEIKKLSEKLDTLSKEFNYLKNDDLPNRFLDIKKEIEKLYDLMKNLKKQNSNNNGGGSSNMNSEASTLDLISEFNDKLSDKVNSSDFDKLLNEIALLNDKINALGKDFRPSSLTDINKNNAIGGKDPNLKDLINKTNDLESLLRRLQK